MSICFVWLNFKYLGDINSKSENEFKQYETNSVIFFIHNSSGSSDTVQSVIQIQISRSCR